MIEVTAPKDRPARLRTTGGVSFALKAGQTRVLPQYVALIAAEAGCAVRPVEKSAPVPDVPKAEDRHAKLAEAVSTLIEEGKPENFTANNMLKVSAVREVFGGDVGSAELTKAYQEVVGGDSR